MLKVLLIPIFLLLSSCSENDVNLITGETMGTTYTIKLVDSEVDKNIIDARLKSVNKTFSTWDENSELSKFNKSPINQWLEVSEELYNLLAYSKKIYLFTEGYFDPGLGELIDLWGFGSISNNSVPTQKQVQEVLSRSSIAYLKFDTNKVKKVRPVQINLSAIAKGYAVDEIGRMLDKLEVKNYLIEIGGEVITKGKNNNKMWVVGLEMPNGSKPLPIELNNEAVATSGDYRNFFVYKGKKYSHILDPHTGYPSISNIASVSVISDANAKSDALATAMLPMGVNKASELIKKLDLKALIILNNMHNNKVIKIGL